MLCGILYLWFRASLIYINNCPTRCNTKQSIYYSASSLYMFRVSTTPIIWSTQNCNYSLRYWSYFLCCYLLPTWPSLATLEGAMKIVQKCVSDVGHNKYLHCVGVTCEISWSKQIWCADHKIWPRWSFKKQFDTAFLHKNVKKKMLMR